MEVEFSSIEELYIRVKPALRTKKNEIKRHGIPYIKEIDIWNYLKEKKWVNCRNLLLHEIVSDILNCDNLSVDEYLKNKLNLRVGKNNLDGSLIDYEK